MTWLVMRAQVPADIEGMSQRDAFLAGAAMAMDRIDQAESHDHAIRIFNTFVVDDGFDIAAVYEVKPGLFFPIRHTAYRAR